MLHESTLLREFLALYGQRRQASDAEDKVTYVDHVKGIGKVMGVHRRKVEFGRTRRLRSMSRSVEVRKGPRACQPIPK